MAQFCITLEDIREARARIAPAIYPTPLIRLPLEGEVYAKAENLQRTNSFKLRGAYNFLAALPEAVRERGVVAHSSGNHAQGLACAAYLFDIPAAIAIPEGAPALKVERTLAWGAEVVRCGASAQARKAAAMRFVEEKGYALVPPYDHPWIMAGQGTAGLEIAQAMPDVANILVCVGGGGLISGLALAISELCPKAQIIAVEPELAADAAESFAKGKRISWGAERVTRTIADGVRIQQVGEYTFPIIHERVHAFITISEADIIAATRWYLTEARLVVEPTGALSLAAYFKAVSGMTEPKLKSGKTVLLISGGNADPELLAQWIKNR